MLSFVGTGFPRPWSAEILPVEVLQILREVDAVFLLEGFCCRPACIQVRDRRGTNKTEYDRVPAKLGNSELHSIITEGFTNGCVEGRKIVLRPSPKIDDEYSAFVQPFPARTQKIIFEQGGGRSALVKGVDKDDVVDPAALFVLPDEVLAGRMEYPQVRVFRPE